MEAVQTSCVCGRLLIMLCASCWLWLRSLLIPDQLPVQLSAQLCPCPWKARLDQAGPPSLLPCRLPRAMQLGSDIRAMQDVPADEKTSMLVLSEFVGCSPSVSGAIRVNPWSVDDVADRIHEVCV